MPDHLVPQLAFRWEHILRQIRKGPDLRPSFTDNGTENQKKEVTYPKHKESKWPRALTMCCVLSIFYLRGSFNTNKATRQVPDSENGLLVAQMVHGCPAHPDAHLGEPSPT